jgi:hypothetical protein
MNVSEVNKNTPANEDGHASEGAIKPRFGWEKISNWLENAGKRVGVPVLVISVVSLCIGIANYRLQIAANKPFLVSYGLKSDSTSMELGFNNVGKTTARRGIATLFALANEGAFPQKLESVPIVGAGTNIFAGAGSNARFATPTITAPAFYLACIFYFDDASTKYEQAFLFRRGARANEYEELAAPDFEVCR